MSSDTSPWPGANRASGETIRAPGVAQQQLPAGLHIVATPIGNLRDITLRALDTLAGVEEILAEDTRMARRLLDAYGITTKVSAYHDHNGAARRPDLLRRLGEGATLALISDAGTPLISDPGHKLVAEAVESGVRIVPVPGASALLAGLVTAGLPTDRFLFAGFPPPKSGARGRFYADLAGVPATLVAYESPRRLAASLADAAEALGGERPASVARELTKLFEETRRGTLSELATHYAETGAPKGEVILLIGLPGEAAEPDEDAIEAALVEAMSTAPLKAAAAQVAARFGLPKREVYQRGLALKDAAR